VALVLWLLARVVALPVKLVRRHYRGGESPDRRPIGGVRVAPRAW
jgi:hypothetical protein